MGRAVSEGPLRVRARSPLAFRQRYNQDVADFAALAPKDTYHPAFTKPLNLRGPLNQDDLSVISRSRVRSVKAAAVRSDAFTIHR